jgi:hypothetical protein
MPLADTTPTPALRCDLAAKCVLAYVAAFKAALKKYPQARRFQALRVQYVTQRAARIALEGDAEEARLQEAVFKAQLDRAEAALPAEARKALL